MTNKNKKGETMDFEEIENLEEEQLNDMYNDIVDFGDDTHLAACCCPGVSSLFNNYSRAHCISWCRSMGSTCTGWATAYYGGYCEFRC